MLTSPIRAVTVSAAAAVTLTATNMKWDGFSIRNGAATVTIVVNDMTIPVYSSEVLEMDLPDFSQIVVTNSGTVSFRLALSSS